MNNKENKLNILLVRYSIDILLAYTLYLLSHFLTQFMYDNFRITMTMRRMIQQITRDRYTVLMKQRRNKKY